MMADTIEGRQPVIEALKSGRAINKIVLADNIGRHSAISEILKLARAGGIPFEFVPRQSIDGARTTSAH